MAFSFNRERVAWAAGLFEGEGCFGLQIKPNGRSITKSSLGMTDADSVIAFAEALPVGRCYGPYDRAPHKAIYNWQTSGFEETQALIAILWPWLSERRRERAREVLEGSGTPSRKRRKDQAWAV